MSAVKAYLNGDWLPFAEARLAVWDAAVTQGATATDMVRTFNGVPFRLREHLRRFADSLAALGIVLPESVERIGEITAEAAAGALSASPSGSDVGVVMFATPGDYEPYMASGFDPFPAANAESRPTLCVHPFPLPWKRFDAWYRLGAATAIPATRQLPAAAIPPGIKHRSRLHWRLADAEARRIDPTAMALLLDERGCLTETNSGNLFVLRGDRLLTPRRETTLAGISQAFVLELAATAGLETARADLRPDDLAGADEAWLSSTTYCLAPVTRVDGRPVGSGVPGPVWRAMVARWSNAVGIDILSQSARLSGRSS